MKNSKQNKLATILVATLLCLVTFASNSIPSYAEENDEDVVVVYENGAINEEFKDHIEGSFSVSGSCNANSKGYTKKTTLTFDDYFDGATLDIEFQVIKKSKPYNGWTDWYGYVSLPSLSLTTKINVPTSGEYTTKVAKAGTFSCEITSGANDTLEIANICKRTANPDQATQSHSATTSITKITAHNLYRVSITADKETSNNHWTNTDVIITCIPSKTTIKYEWFKDDILMANENTDEITVSNAGSYKCRATSYRGFTKTTIPIMVYVDKDKPLNLNIEIKDNPNKEPIQKQPIIFNCED